MTDHPFVTIIIPFYNTPEKEFRRCIDSLINQTCSDFEAIVINDGSEEKYNEALNNVVSLDSRVRLINKANEGSAIARNLGISEAKGEYIMFLDSDDALTGYCLEEAVDAVNKYNADLVIGGVQRVTEEDFDSLNPVKQTTTDIIKVGPDDSRDKLMAHMIGYTNDMFKIKNGYIGDGPVARVVRRSIASESLFSRESMWSDDTIWNTKMLKKCENTVIVDDLWYKYLIFPFSKTRRFRPNCPNEFDFRTKQELDLFKELWPNCMEGIYVRVFNDIFLFCRTFLFHPDNPLSWKEKYGKYKACIHGEAYREALREVDFKKDKRFVNRTVKGLLRFTAYHGPNIVSYWILKAFYNLKKNAL